ncbi:MAG TPA: PepSY-associated TM helix domain-containing protein [Fontimonas sp.]
MSTTGGSRRSLGARFHHWRSGGQHGAHRPSTPQPRRNLTMTLREWHKRVGLFAFAFMGWLGASGFLINQSAEWGYDTVRIDSPIVMALYGLHPVPPATGFSSGGRWLSVTSDYTLLDAQPIAERIHEPLGFVAGGSEAKPLLFVGTSGSLTLLTTDGALYDQLQPPILPVSTIRRIGTTADGAIVVQDLDAFQSKDSGDSWTPVDPTQVTWSVATRMPEENRQALLPYSKPSVSLEHVLVDAHSGRLFGNVGAWIINLVGFGAFWLSLSGVWMWWRIRQNRRPVKR